MPTVGQIEKGKLLEYRSCGENRYIWLACPDCGKEKWVMLSRAKRQGYIIRCRGCAAKLRAPEQSQRMTGSGNYQWKGGRHKTSQGYISVWVPPDSPYYKMARKHRNRRTCVTEHRLVMAKHERGTRLKILEGETRLLQWQVKVLTKRINEAGIPLPSSFG